MSEQLGLNLTEQIEEECLHCGYKQMFDVEPDEWTWVDCVKCGEGFHINMIGR